MPTITITDELNADLVVTDPSPASGLAKYFKGNAATFLAGFQAANVLRQPLALAAAQPIRSAFSLQHPIELGSNNLSVSLGGGVESFVEIAPSGTQLFEQELFGDPIEAPFGQAYVSFTLTPSVNAGVAHANGNGSLGFAVGASVQMRSCRPFEAGAANATVGSALRSVLKDFTIPLSCDDLREMAPGTVAVVGGSGSFQISGSFALAVALNPLATPKLPLVPGQITLQAGASLSVGGSCRISGEYQIRVQKLTSDKVRLGLYRKAGSTFSVDVNASLGADAAFGKRDVIKSLMSAISSDPKADIEQLVNADLSDQQIDNFVLALSASINRSLTVSLEASFSSSREADAAFLYELDLATLDARSNSAIDLALGNDFTALTSSTAGPLLGITTLRDQTSQLRKRSVRLRFNLFGIVNVLRLTELVKSGSVTYEPVTGDLNIADTVSSDKIRISTRPFEADGAKLRKAVMESIIVTAAYRASTVVSAAEFTASQSYFELHQRTNLQTMTDNLEAAIAAGLASQDEKSQLLGDARDFGVSTFLMETQFSEAAFQAMFLDAGGKPRSREFYENIGRKTMRALVEFDPQDFRHVPLASDPLWKNMVQVGPPGFGQILPPSLRTTVRRAVIEADYLVIVWWSTCMATAATALAEMKQFLAGTDPAALHNDPEFARRRTALINTLSNAVAKNQSQFGDPWGLLAMDAAATGLANARAVITSSRLNLIRERN